MPARSVWFPEALEQRLLSESEASGLSFSKYVAQQLENPVPDLQDQVEDHEKRLERLEGMVQE